MKILMKLFDKKTFWVINTIWLRMTGLRIGFKSYVGPVLYLKNRKNVIIGNRVRIWPGLRIEVYNNAVVKVEDDVAIGPYCHITAAEDLTIRKGSLFVGWNTITNITHKLEELNKSCLERPWEVNATVLGERLFVGQGAKILPGCKIGSGSAIGANAVVTKLKSDDNSVIVGIPGKIKRVIN